MLDYMYFSEHRVEPPDSYILSFEANVTEEVFFED